VTVAASLELVTMRSHRRFVIALVAAVLTACGGGSEGFKLIHIDDLVGMQKATERPVTVLDANKDDFRAREGIILGATLLSSYSKYDVASELPPAKDARLVFYCADSH
jgi:hypothetical protein